MPNRKPTLLDFQPALSLDGRRVTVDSDTRRIAVRVANFGEVHSGFGPEVRVPRNANLDAAHVGTADLADGSALRVAVLPMDTAHAPANLQALHAASWYENSGKGIARGRYSIDDTGVRFDGILFDDVDSAKMDRLTAGSASGDWRSAIALKSFGDFEHAPADFVGSCIVNIGGYSDTYRQAPAERFALVASAAGDLISIENGALMAASAGADGLSDQDVRDAWEQYKQAIDQRSDNARNAAEASGQVYVEPAGPQLDSAYINEIFFEPRKVIVCADGVYFDFEWDTAADGTIFFGAPKEVEQTWIPVTESNAMGNTLIAGAASSDDKNDATVTITASALLTLVAGNEPEDENVLIAAQDEARTALVAGGFMEKPDPRDARLAVLERALIADAFGADD